MATSWYLIQKRSSLRRKGVFTIVIAFHLTWERNYAAQSRQLTCAETAFSPMGIFPGNQSGVNCGVSRHVEPSNRDFKVSPFHREYGQQRNILPSVTSPVHRCRRRKARTSEAQAPALRMT